MINVANGNLLMQSDDIDIPERGIDLAFRRTYNSHSQHDQLGSALNGTDGAPASVYGNGWTSTFDAHMAYNSGTNTLSVYDLDGARYDYTVNPSYNSSLPVAPGNSPWAPPAGMQGTTLVWDGCGGYKWTKKSGSTYYFYAPTPGCNTPAAMLGRLYQIWGHNHHNYLQFNYSFVNGTGGAGNPQNLNTIVVSHSDGDSLTLQFAQFSGYTELASITPTTHGAVQSANTITYSYDTAGNLLQVGRPGTAVDDQTGQAVTTPLQEGYGYYMPHLLNFVESPRYVWSMQAHPSTPDGAYYAIGYSGSGPNSAVLSISDSGLVNPTPNDGTASAIQTGNAFVSGWRQTTFTWGATTVEADTQGHSAAWTANSAGNVTQTQEWPGNGALPLVTDATWASNLVTSTTDARTQVATYSYDSNGNTTMVQLPSVPTNLGPGNPTSTYSYDQFSNLTSYCDANYNWPSAKTCAPGAGATYYTYDYSDANEPYGKLTDTQTPMGYHRHISYDQTDGGDYGLPTTVQGAGVSQPIDPTTTTRTPTQTFTYDSSGYGNLVAYNSGNGTWNIAYDVLNRPLLHTDPDGIANYTYYNNDGSVSETDTAYQKALGAGHKFTYDADGNVLTSTARSGGNIPQSSGQYGYTVPVAQVTQKYYDGEDRLVEVVQPYDSTSNGHEEYTAPWITRYLYDLTNNATVTFNGITSVHAYGNLFETQELLPPGASAVQVSNSGKISNTTFQPMKGNAFDALDRAVQKYTIVNNQNSIENLTYDTNGNNGLLSLDCTQLNICKTPTYDTLGHTTRESFSDGTAPKSFTFDPDGRVMTASDTQFGQETFTYDNDGHQLSKTEQPGGGVTSASTITHEYYLDGMLNKIDVSSPNFTQAGLFTYAYRADGAVETEQVNDTGNALVGTTTLSMTYKPSGRLAGRTESGPGAAGSESFTYDTNYGFKTSESFGPNSFTGISYDAEGNLLSYTWPGQANFAGFDYTVRGEMEQLYVLNAQQPYANGTGVPAAPSGPGMTGSTTLDAHLGLITGSSYNNGYQAGTDGYVTSTSGTTIDADGRVKANTTYSESDHYKAINDSTYAIIKATNVSRSYDALNHVISTTAQNEAANSSFNNFYSSAASYGWGVNEHPLLVGVAQASSLNGSTYPPQPSVNSYDTLHWDGDQPLFETNSSGQVDEIFIGQSGAITPLDNGYRGLTWFDRDPRGLISYCRNATGNGIGSGAQQPGLQDMVAQVCGTSPAYSVPQFITTGGTKFVGQGGVITMPRTDGIYDGVNVIQGERVYDPQVGGWTTPDAYQGEVHDPASQKSYMWNGNNGVSYSDPSGFIELFRDDADEGDMSPGELGASGGGSSTRRQNNGGGDGGGGSKAPPQSQVVAQVVPPESDPVVEKEPMGDPITAEQRANGAENWANDGKNAEAWEDREFNKHSKEWGGDLTKKEYTNIGVTLRSLAMQQAEQGAIGKNVDVKWQPGWGGGRYLVYEHTTNSLGVYTETGAIVTIYRPVQGRNFIVNAPGTFVNGIP